MMAHSEQEVRETFEYKLLINYIVDLKIVTNEISEATLQKVIDTINKIKELENNG